MRRIFIFLLAALAFCVGTMPALSQSQETGHLRVLIKPVPPFVIDNPDRPATGFSIDLWRAIEKQLNVQSEFRMLPDVSALLAGIENGEGDVAIAAVTITADREEKLDFSHPYFRSGLQIMVPNKEIGMLARAVSVIGGMFASPSFRFAMLALAILVLVAAHIMWLVERRKNPEFTCSYPLGLWDAIYWTLVTISTVGYGDKTPKSHLGRMIALVLIVFGYIAFAWFTATIASTLTVSRLEGEIRGPGDLAGEDVATLRGSTGAAYLQSLPGVRVRLFDTIEQAYDALETGRVAALVYDYPVLSHYVSGEGAGKVRLTGPVFQRESYGIVFPQNSSWREPINQILLQLEESGEYDRIYQKWFNTLPE